MALNGMSRRRQARAPYARKLCYESARTNGQSFFSYLVETEESEFPDDGESGDLLPGGDLSSHLEADLDDLERVCEHDLRSTSLRSLNSIIGTFGSRSIHS